MVDQFRDLLEGFRNTDWLFYSRHRLIGPGDLNQLASCSGFHSLLVQEEALGGWKQKASVVAHRNSSRRLTVLMSSEILTLGTREVRQEAAATKKLNLSAEACQPGHHNSRNYS